ncbi:MAG: methyltransferase domain-containing protein [Gammaproteobacteria bacterium]|nr:methyltransferase domain-containing protein [Gammaproteobacteria bacterium]
MNILEKNRKAFEAQAIRFSPDGKTFADDEELRWMLADLPMAPELKALDVAAGTGEFARAMAAHVSNVTAVDATEAMLAKGRDFVRENAIKNVEFRKGVAEDLAFDDATFDIVACRYAFHHFGDPKPVLSEMVRVCKSQGFIITVDIVVPDDETATTYNYYERLVDDSHTRCLGFGEFQSLYGLFGLEIHSAKCREVEESVTAWMNFALTPEERQKVILGAIQEELEAGTKTGLSPYRKGAELYFKQKCAVLVGRKS